MPNLSISVDLGISDIIASVRDFMGGGGGRVGGRVRAGAGAGSGGVGGVFQRGRDLTTGILGMFDTIMLRVIVVIILLATTVLTVLAIPHAALIVEWCIVSLYKAFTMLQTQITPQNILLVHQWLLPVGLMLSLL